MRKSRIFIAIGFCWLAQQPCILVRKKACQTRCQTRLRPLRLKLR